MLPSRNFNRDIRSGYSHPVFRQWQSSGTELHAHNFMLPLFILSDPDGNEPIESMPGVHRMGINTLITFLKPVVDNGLAAVLLFGVSNVKDPLGACSQSPDANPVITAIQKIKDIYPFIVVACDVCLCPFTDHGHCGVLRSNSEDINNEVSIEYLSELALCFARAGADIVAPSDMMDGRVGAIKAKLYENGFGDQVAVLSYAVKMASGFYGPFRNAVKTKLDPTNDRKKYQLPPGSASLAARAAKRDVSEGADMLMVKPGLAYLDLVLSTKKAFPHLPLFVYQVSGEYSMIRASTQSGCLDLKTVLTEIFVSMRRAGADVIISYYTPTILGWL